MAQYLSRFKYDHETWASLIKNPGDRRTNIAQGLESTGGKLLGLWYSLGDSDGFVLFESPNNVAAAAALTKWAASGSLRLLETSALMSVEEMIEALRIAGSVPFIPFQQPG